MSSRKLIVPFLALLLAVSLSTGGVALAAPHGSSLSHAGHPLVATLKALPGYRGQGFARLTDNPGHQRICYKITTKGVTKPVMAAHIHAAATSRIVVGFFSMASHPMATIFQGCVHVRRALAKTILMHPRRYFIMVHTNGMTPILKGGLRKPGSSTSSGSSSGSSGYGPP